MDIVKILGHMRSPRSAKPSLVVLTLAAGFAGCFEPPVAERLLLEFSADGSARATLMIDLARPEDFESAAARRRIATRERELFEESDPWFTRFAGLTSGDDGLSWRRSTGTLREFRRWAELADPAGFNGLFADDPVSFAYSRNADLAVLELTPTGASRATRKERQRVESEVAAWSAAFARYLDRVFALERYLSDHPEKRKSCWQRVFDVKSDVASEGEPSAAKLSSSEEALTRALSDRLGELLAAFEIDPADAYSLDERVRKVFHPLSAQLFVALPAEATEVEGFEADEPGDDDFGYAFPECSLLAALDRLEGRWLVTGPLRAMLDHLRGSSPDAPMDIAKFIEAPVTKESATPPAVSEVAEPLLKLFRPASTYRLVWRIPESELPQ